MGRKKGIEDKSGTPRHSRWLLWFGSVLRPCAPLSQQLVLRLEPAPRATHIAGNRSSREWDSNSIQHVAHGGKKEERLGIILRETPWSRHSGLCRGWCGGLWKGDTDRKELTNAAPTSSNYSAYCLTPRVLLVSDSFERNKTLLNLPT